MRPGRLGRVWFDRGRWNAPAPELLRDGAVLLAADVRGVHGLANDGALPRLSRAGVRSARGAGEDHGGQPALCGPAAPDGRGARVQPTLPRLRPASLLQNRGL